MNHGFHESLSFAEYADVEAMNYSRLKHIERSPMAYRFHCDNPTKPTAPMVLGNAAHKAILEPACTQFAVFTGKVRNGHAYDAWAEENAGKTQLNQKEWDYVVGVKDAVHANPIARKYLRFGKRELTMVWPDPTFRRDFKARIDNFIEINDEPVLVSLKTTTDCRDFTFASQYAKLCYTAQDALYQAGFYYLNHQLPRMVTIAVESKPPHDVAVYRIPTDVLRQGQQLVSKWMEALTACERANEWPGAVEGEQDLVLASWATPDGDFSFDDLEPIER